MPLIQSFIPLRALRPGGSLLFADGHELYLTGTSEGLIMLCNESGPAKQSRTHYFRQLARS